MVVELERSCDRRQQFVVDLSEHIGQTATVLEHSAGSEPRIRHCRRDPRCLQQGLPIPGVTDQALRLTEPDQRSAALDRIAGAEQLDRVAEQPCRLRGGEAVERLLARARGVVRRLRPTDRHGRQPPVQRQLPEVLAGVGLVQLLQRPCYALVRPRASRCAESFVERLLDQCVNESKPPHSLGRLLQQRRGDSPLELIQEPAFIGLNDLRE